ncbi:putative amino-acid ABC transporter-binding protein YhdW [Rhodovastum atsumiense]|uniref:Amino acid ABC transporter substrate-binding protein n=1 Tax=Rhodovastum atsumiense TaxID=504468 RepID=A0A5M6IST2_9PROT|nr:amino acid ABC transporter substrate-binding protein [Rhodovastum atsumiense]KAA5610505.1 amino acid ABC transporter substrate-binding protein [Rhodovastum atsumiense]CAH2600492.1 putative amino-acid ABC transporter-binding protein YhdW [Rhodovastum atsumiense]
MFRPLAVLASTIVCTTLLATSSAPAQAQGSGSATLDAVRARGQLVCGIAGVVPGFSLPDSTGVMRGLDADSCRTVAAAVLGDASKIKFVPLTTTSRFTALQSGEVDLLVRSTTWTLGREANLGLLFAGVNYYDGTGFLVKTSLKVKSAKELDGATICVQPGTSTELAIADYFRVNKMKFTPILIQDLAEIQQAFLSGRCDAYSTDGSALATFRATQPNKDNFVLLPEVISKEPLGYVVRKGDDKWFDIVRWTYFVQLIAEEYGITSKNVDSFNDSKVPEVRRLLGLEGDMGKALLLDNKFAYNVVKQVGNFAEIWDRNITVLGVPRGVNNLWNKGGLQYAPPIR